MQNQSAKSGAAHQTMMIVWFALFMSQLLFLGMAFFVKPELLRFDLTRPLLGENAAIVAALAGFSIFDLIFSFVQRKKYLEQAVAEQNVAMVQTAMIIGCAMSEAVSLFGLFLAFAFNYPYFFLFSAAGIISVLFHFPRRSSIDAASYRGSAPVI